MLPWNPQHNDKAKIHSDYLTSMTFVNVAGPQTRQRKSTSLHEEYSKFLRKFGGVSLSSGNYADLMRGFAKLLVPCDFYPYDGALFDSSIPYSYESGW